MLKKAIAAREIPAEKRISGFDEVTFGYSETEAGQEAGRCLQCKNPACIAGCPVKIDIKKFIRQTAEKDYTGAYWTIKEKNNFPSICGRVCPAEYQCRRVCVLNKSKNAFSDDNAVNVHFLERFIGDYGMRNNLDRPLKKNNSSSKTKVAVIGSGPAGLCCAGELARGGIETVIFEGLHKPGGVLRYGIPPFRLPQDILDFEIANLEKYGVKILPNIILGRTKTLKELFAEGFSRVFLGLGAGVPGLLNIKGENLCNVYSANEFLVRVNLMRAYKFPEYHTPLNIGKRVLVIGGGNTAMDAARAALRLQKQAGIFPNAAVFYRRTEEDMPARRLEIIHAKEEGVQFNFLVKPQEFTGDSYGNVVKLRCLKCRQGETDSSGRKKPLPIEGSDFETDCDTVIIAVGLSANALLTSVTPALETDKHGDLIVSAETMETSVKNVYAGGDITGGETVIEAMGMAKIAAGAILKSL